MPETDRQTPESPNRVKPVTLINGQYDVHDMDPSIRPNLLLAQPSINDIWLNWISIGILLPFPFYHPLFIYTRPFFPHTQVVNTELIDSTVDRIWRLYAWQAPGLDWSGCCADGPIYFFPQFPTKALPLFRLNEFFQQILRLIQHSWESFAFVGKCF